MFRLHISLHRVAAEHTSSWQLENARIRRTVGTQWFLLCDFKLVLQVLQATHKRFLFLFNSSLMRLMLMSVSGREAQNVLEQLDPPEPKSGLGTVR